MIFFFISDIDFDELDTLIGNRFEPQMTVLGGLSLLNTVSRQFTTLVTTPLPRFVFVSKRFYLN